MSAELDPLALLEALEPGKRMWLSARGESMWPLLRSGDVLLVERADAHHLQVGEIAILKSKEGMGIAHGVSHLDPLTTQSFGGLPDESGLVVLGKAVRIRRGASEWPLTHWHQWQVRIGAHLGATTRSLRRSLKSRFWEENVGLECATRPIRQRAMGLCTIRLLREDELPLLAQCIPSKLAPNEESLRKRLPPNGQTVLGTFRQRLILFASCRFEQGTLHLDAFYRHPLLLGLGGERSAIALLLSKNPKSEFKSLKTLRFLSSAFVELGFRLEHDDEDCDTWKRVP